MSIVPSGLGWFVDSAWLANNTNSLGTISGRSYYKTTSTPTIAMFNGYNNSYHQLVLLSTDPDGVKYTTSSGGGTFTYTNTYEIDGTTWYYNSGNYGYYNGTITTDYPIITEYNLLSPTQQMIESLLSMASVSFLPSYTIHFDANGGTGTMADQRMTVNISEELELNTFTREYYIFAGWATSQYGAVEYTDGQFVRNLAEADETVTLYAKWNPLPMSIKLQTNNSEKNKLDKDIITNKTLWGTLKSDCSIVDPVILIECDLLELVNCNYITIDLFKRSYFINNIKSVRKNLNEISCHVDVISSFKNEIRSNKAIIQKQENEWNLYLNDGSLKTYQNSVVTTHEFPSGFSTQEFVLAVAGS